MTTRKISSRDNPVFRELLRITTSARERRQLGVSFIEGIHLCQSYLERYGAPRQVVFTDAALSHPEVGPLLKAAAPGSVHIELSGSLFKDLSQVEHGIGIAYVINTPLPDLPEALATDCVYLDGLQDPGNVGTILRTCAAVGVTQVITAPGTAWCWSPKVLRAGMGAHFALVIHESVDWQRLQPRLRIPVLATAPQAQTTIWQADLREPCLWLMGSEGSGLSPDLQARQLRWVSIPQRADVESLNVAVAAAVCLFEQMRQRSQPV